MIDRGRWKYRWMTSRVAKRRAETLTRHESNQLQRFSHGLNMPEDTRKSHVLTTIANYFGVEQNLFSSLADHRALNSFLDDTNCPLLSAARGNKNSIDLSNEVRQESSFSP